jgi:hypothetical protein
MVLVDWELSAQRSDVDVDTDLTALRELQDVQHHFYAGFDQPPQHPGPAPLCTELNVWPLAFRSLQYLLKFPFTHPARIALKDSFMLHLQSSPGWWADIVWALAHLPVPI